MPRDSSDTTNRDVQITDEFIEQVEGAVGMWHGAWDMVPAKELILAVISIWDGLLENPADCPLQSAIEGDQLVIRIGLETLKTAAQD